MWYNLTCRNIDKHAQENGKMGKWENGKIEIVFLCAPIAIGTLRLKCKNVSLNFIFDFPLTLTFISVFDLLYYLCTCEVKMIKIYYYI